MAYYLYIYYAYCLLTLGLLPVRSLASGLQYWYTAQMTVRMVNRKQCQIRRMRHAVRAGIRKARLVNSTNAMLNKSANKYVFYLAR